MKPPAVAGFLVRLPASSRASLAAGGARSRLRAAGVRFELEPLFEARPGSPAALGVGAAGGWQWHVAKPTSALDGAHAWEVAHALNAAAAAAAGGPVLVEPDFIQEWPYENPRVRAGGSPAASDACVFNDQVASLPKVDGRFAWHLDDGFSQLRRARTAAAGAGTTAAIRIAHLDTGYDPTHHTVPAHVRTDLQRNVVDDQPAGDAHDPGPRGGIGSPGHGTGTLSILAGNRIAWTQNGYTFNDVIGGAPDAEIVPVRVGRSVVHLLTSNIARGIYYAASLCADERTRVHVLSMSMGGVASAAWADAVNLAYDAGIVFVAAAGNNFSAGFFGVPTHFIVYPARFRRVIAACGVMADRTPYYGLPFGTMQGSWGPASKMATAVSAYTPNTPWAELGCPGIVDLDGAGTSAATPQVAAAAALYLQRHAAVLFDTARYPEPWMRVEAVRQALFAKADKTANGGSPEKLGNGILQAADALLLQPPLATALHEAAPDSAVFPLLRVLTGVGIASSSQADTMLALEATQLAHRWAREEQPNPIETAVPDPDLPAEAIPPAQVRRFLEAVLEHPDASAPLRERVAQARRTLLSDDVLE
jgi:subtilisin family serine protease